MSATDLGYRYLNQDGHWGDFTLHGLEAQADGSLTLASTPVFTGVNGVAGAPEPAYPAGIAVSGTGALYFTTPEDARLMRVDPCDGSVTAVPCLNLESPRGLAFHRERNALLICDACAAGALLIYDVDTWELLESRRGFDSPVAVAVDEMGNCFVAEAGAKRVRKFSPSGDPDAAFNAALEAANLIQDPGAVAVFGSDLYVLDDDLLDVLVFDAEGRPLKGQDVLWEDLERPCGLAVTADSIYVGDNGRRAVVRYRNAAGYGFAAEAVGFQGTVAALAVGGKSHGGELLVNTGTGTAPVALSAGSGFSRVGTLTGGPFKPGSLPVAWHSLHAGVDPLPAGCQFQLFVFAGTAAPAAVQIGANPFPAPWRPAPPGVSDVFIGGDPALRLWVGATLTGNGIASPKLTELKARFNQKTYLPYLPAVYANTARDNDFLHRLLALFESFNSNNEDLIARLPELFDAAAIPAGFLPWLATWLDADLDQHWDTAKQRDAIARAYQQYARRGTVGGLRDAIAFETGVQVTINEPIQDAHWWVLPAVADPCGPAASDDEDSSVGSSLGLSTMLGYSIPQGAVVGSTAILNRSRIIAPEDVGTPLFDQAAHRFTVILPGSASAAGSAAVSDAVSRVVDREKPAHTAYHVCRFEPRMSVGFQARVGIDTIVGGVDSGQGGLLLGGHPPTRIGKQTRIGDGLRL